VSRLLPLTLQAGVALARCLPPRLVITAGAAAGRFAGRLSSRRRIVAANLRAIQEAGEAWDRDSAAPPKSAAGSIPSVAASSVAASSVAGSSAAASSVAASSVAASSVAASSRAAPSGAISPGEVFASYGRYWAELLLLAARPGWLDRQPLRLDGAEHLSAAAARGAVCAVSAHVGNWDLGARWARRFLPGLAVVAERLEPPGLFAFFCRLRGREAGEVLAADRGGAALFRRWRRGEHVAFLADRIFGRSARAAPFLGRPRRFPSAGLDLARRAGATIVPVFLVREAGGYVLRVHPPLPAEEDPVAAFARALEQEVRRSPEQWCLLFPVFPLARERMTAGGQGDTSGRAAARLAAPGGLGA